MRLSVATGLILLLSPVTQSLSIPQTDIAVAEQDVSVEAPEVADLEKRRGGGGGGRGGSSGSSGSSSSGSSGGRGSSGSSGSSSSGSSSGSSRSGSTSSSSNAGGTSKSGSGTSRSYGGGTYYPGGASTPYTAGARSSSGITPYLIGGAALGFAAGVWAHPLYGYPYGVPYTYHHPINKTENDNGNYTLNIVCLCEEYQTCGCDGNTNSTYLNEIIGDPPHNSSAVTIMKNGTNETAYINGTLANGTTAATGSGSSLSAMQWNGYFPAVAIVSAMVWAL